MSRDEGRRGPGGPDEHDDDGVLAALEDAMGHDPHRTPPPDRVAAIRAAAARMGDQRPVPSADVRPLPPRAGRRMLLTGGIAAGVGGIAGYAVRAMSDGGADTATPPGPPLEPIAFDGAPATVGTEARLINHTWGTELLLDVTGLEPGRTYDVVFDTAAGEVAAGSLLAVDGVVMVCRFSAAPLRADVRTIEVREAGGSLRMRADLPPVDA